MSVLQTALLSFLEKCDFDSGVLQSPIVYSARQKIGIWRIYMITSQPLTRLIMENIIKNRSHSDLIPTFYSKSGVENGKITKSGSTDVICGKNLGKANATTPVMQALVEMKSAWDLKIKKGGVLDKSQLLFKSISFSNLLKIPGEAPWRVYPMALHDFKKHSDRLCFPVWVQPKYDGTRFIAVNTGKIDGYSRGGKTCHVQHILDELAPMLQQYPGLYLDGELWKPGANLQAISGASRRSVDNHDLVFMVFDCFHIDNPQVYEERRLLRNKIITESSAVRLVNDESCKNLQEIQQIYKKYLKQGLEGAVLRNLKGLYQFGLNKEMRSYDVLKYKPDLDDEWPVIGFGQGERGKDKGALMWRCEITAHHVARLSEKYNQSMEMPTENKSRFDVSIKGMTYPQRYAAYEFLIKNPDYFQKNLLNQLITIKFSTISDNGKPQQAKALRFQDSDVQKDFMQNIK